MIELLATCTLQDVRPDLPPVPRTPAPPPPGASCSSRAWWTKPPSDERVAKRRDELTRQVTAMEARLNNAGYLAKAPPHLVEQTQKQMAEAKAELEKLG